MRIRNGQIKYRDDRSGASEEFTAIDVDVTGERLTDPISLDGAFIWHDERLAVKMDLETLSHIWNGQAARLRFDLKSRPAVVAFNGELALGVRTKIQGPFSLSTPSMAGLARWTGADLRNSAALGPAALKGALRATPAEVALTGANLSVGETRSTGDVVVEFGEERPKIKANLTVSQLDIDKLAASFENSGGAERSNSNAT